MAFIPKGFSLIFGRIFQRLGKLSDTQLIIVQIYVRPPFYAPVTQFGRVAGSYPVR